MTKKKDVILKREMSEGDKTFLHELNLTKKEYFILAKKGKKEYIIEDTPEWEGETKRITHIIKYGIKELEDRVLANKLTFAQSEIYGTSTGLDSLKVRMKLNKEKLEYVKNYTI